MTKTLFSSRVIMIVSLLGIIAALVTLYVWKQPESMTGCYEVDFPGFESGHTTEKFKLTHTINNEYVMEGLTDKSNSQIPMKKATEDELKRVGEAFQFHVIEGISMKWNSDPKKQISASDEKPIGFYRGIDGQGKKFTFAFFFISNGIAKEISCSASSTPVQKNVTTEPNKSVKDAESDVLPKDPANEKVLGRMWAIDQGIMHVDECVSGTVDFIEGCKSAVAKLVTETAASTTKKEHMAGEISAMEEGITNENGCNKGTKDFKAGCQDAVEQNSNK